MQAMMQRGRVLRNGRAVAQPSQRLLSRLRTRLDTNSGLPQTHRSTSKGLQSTRLPSLNLAILSATDNLCCQVNFSLDTTRLAALQHRHIQPWVKTRTDQSQCFTSNTTLLRISRWCTRSPTENLRTVPVATIARALPARCIRRTQQPKNTYDVITTTFQDSPGTIPRRTLILLHRMNNFHRLLLIGNLPRSRWLR